MQHMSVKKPMSKFMKTMAAAISGALAILAFAGIVYLIVRVIISIIEMF